MITEEWKPSNVYGMCLWKDHSGIHNLYDEYTSQSVKMFAGLCICKLLRKVLKFLTLGQSDTTFLEVWVYLI